MLNLRWLNHRKEGQRVRNGKPAKLADLSMEKHFEQQEDGAPRVSEKGTEGTPVVSGATAESAERLDQTDQENDEFTYVL